MVASPGAATAVASMPTKPPTLSYADRAKKAQNLNITNNNKPHLVSATSSSTATTSNTSPTPTSADVTPSSSLVLTRPASPPMNGDVQPISPQKPVVNVWSLRREQMAQQAQQSQPRPTPSAQINRSTSVGGKVPTPLAARNSNTPDDSTPPPPLSGNRKSRSGGAAESPSVDDPFVVRPARAPSHSHSRSQSNPRKPLVPSPALPPPPPDDAESWPEVGKNLSAGGSEGEGGSGSGSVSANGKKGEKTKWVQIPPAELQATADALTPRHRKGNSKHHRNQSQAKSHNNSNSNLPTAKNSSANNSNNASGSGSRIHSRVGSLQNSPKVRGRRSPGDVEVTAGGKSSRDVSPVKYPHGQMQGGVYVPYPSQAPAPAPEARTGYYTPPSHPPPQQQQHYHHPSQTHSQTHSHHSSLSHSPMPGQYGLPLPGASAGPSGSGSGFHSPFGPGAYPPFGGYEYPGQPYPAYWGEQERHQQQQGYGVPYGYVRHPQQQVVPPQLQAPQPPPPQQLQPPLMFGEVEGEVPPATMLVKPPPPGESGAVAGYREVGEEEARGQDRGRKGVVFGSIGMPGTQSPAEPSRDLPQWHGEVKENTSGDGTDEKPFTAFSIGVAPGEPDLLRIRSRTHSTKARARKGEEGVTHNGKGEEGANGSTHGEVKVIDLTDPETKWEFGTTKQPEGEVGEGPTGFPQQPTPPLQADVNVPVRPSAGYFPPPTPQASHEQTPGLAPANMPLGPPIGLSPITTPPNGLQVEVNRMAGAGPASLLSAEPPQSARSDDFAVKDFGYGFGTTLTRDQRIERERVERGIENREREERERGEYIRQRRASYAGPAYPPFEQQRGGYVGRRGRGYGGRGYGGRGYSRGGYQNQQVPRQPPFSVTPPARFQVLPQGDPVNGYYQPPTGQLVSYLPGGYETYQHPPPPVPIQPLPAPAAVAQGLPPVPVPLSTLSFPLDPTRYYLLGQLEYYLSPQNLAQDFYLRQRMDSRGWIPISLIASFKRVRTLTPDIALVTDVLILSSIVEVRDEWVRMGGNQWEPFVLPDAPTSIVEPPLEARNAYMQMPVPNEAPQPGPEHASGLSEESPVDSEHVEGEVEDEDEDDVVFVMGRDVEESWTAGRRPV